MKQNRSLASKVHRPILVLSLACFLLFEATSYMVIHRLVFDSIEEQAEATIDIFTSSVRDDILNGFDTEVFRKCQSVLRNTLVTAIKVNGLDNRNICDEFKVDGLKGFPLTREVYFNPQDKIVAGTVDIRFQSTLAGSIVRRILGLLVLTVLLLLTGYWIVSNYLVRKETRKFTELATMLTESDINTLEQCTSHFQGEQTQELRELCLGVEKLSKNWRAYQEELVRNEKLKAVNESSRLLAHDIKSPLGAIKTVAQMLESKPQMSKELLNKGLARIEKMLADILKNDERSEIINSLVESDINAFFEGLGRDLAPMYQDMIDVQFENRIRKPTTLRIDRDQVERGVRNLVKNAAEATGAEGRIKIVLSKTDSHIEITVEDDGPGLPDSIATDFGKGPLKSTKSGGTGLGIYQVQQTMDSHKGTLHVTTSNSGTKISLKFKV